MTVKDFATWLSQMPDDAELTLFSEGKVLKPTKSHFDSFDAIILLKAISEKNTEENPEKEMPITNAIYLIKESIKDLKDKYPMLFTIITDLEKALEIVEAVEAAIKFQRGEK